MSWLDEHLETVVRPYLGTIPAIDYKSSWIKSASLDNLKVLFNLWEAAKKRCGQRTMLLPGRDVWEFEILARIDGYPSLFRPDISSNTKTVVKGNFRDCFLLDSGAAGSIPKTLGVEHWSLVHYSQTSDRDKKQLSLGPTTATTDDYLNVYYLLEGLPKYWVRATTPWATDSQGVRVRQLPVVQSYSHPIVFGRAAQTTIHIARTYMLTKKASQRPRQPYGSRFL